jgi:hypothetical protein
MAGAPVSQCRRLPNLIIIGVAKAGTTSLFEYLAQHPDVCGADEKELYYFSASRFGEEIAPLESYADHFRHCTGERWVMEATPGYFFGGVSTISHMQSVLGRPHLLLSLRDPVTRFYSYYAFHFGQGHLPSYLTPAGYLKECLQLRADGRDGQREHIAYWGLSGGCYVDQLRSWSDAFGDRLHVVFLEHLKEDPQKMLAEICEWAGIAKEALPDIDVTAANPSARYRSSTLRTLQLSVRERGAALRGRAPGVYRLAARAMRSVNATTAGIPALDDATRRALDDYYRDSNARTGVLLRSRGYRNLPGLAGGSE